MSNDRKERLARRNAELAALDPGGEKPDRLVESVTDQMREAIATRDRLIEQLGETLEQMVRSGKAHGPAESGIVRTSYDAHCRAAAALAAYREWKEGKE